MESTKLLDTIGHKILDQLSANARLSYAEVGRRVGLSPSAATERVQRMEDAGIIRGYRVDIDLEKIGLPILVIVQLKVDRSIYSHALKQIVALDEVIECHRTTGASALILKVALRSMEHLETFINEMMQFGEPVTSVVLSTPLSRKE